MAISQQDRLTILQEVSQSWLDLRKAIDARSDAELVKPNTVGQWSIKDVMGHITFWEQHLLENVQAADAGEEPDEIEDFEAANMEAASAVADQTLAEIREEFNDTHEELMSVLETTPSLSREQIAGSTFGHYNEHTADIRAIKR